MKFDYPKLKWWEKLLGVIFNGPKFLSWVEQEEEDHRRLQQWFKDHAP